jgi:sugar transferase EpsL
LALEKKRNIPTLLVPSQREGAPQKAYASFLKRLLDVGGAAFLLVALSPVMLAVWFLVRWKMGAPAVFSHARPGVGGRPFVLYKFRTMTDDQGRDLPDAARLTPFGRWLRRMSLDEFPQLWNVLRGEMSLVGPRPLRLDYLPYMTPREMLRHTVRPGITGWAQIHGRNESAWDERLANDVWYVENWSLWLDVKILFLTVFKVLRSKNVVADPQSVMKNLNEERAHMKRAA